MLRGNRGQETTIGDRRLGCGSHVGVRVEETIERGGRVPSGVADAVEPHHAARAERRLLWGTDECGQAASQMRGGRTDSVPGRDVIVPVGEQVRPVSHGSPVRHYDVCGRQGSGSVFWTREAHHPTATRSLPPRPAIQTRGKIDLSAVQNVRRNANVGDAAREILPLPSRRPTAPVDGYVVYPEVREAIRRGYSIVQIHEVWHFPVIQQKFGLFRDYVNRWLKNKTEASGYPHWADTPEKKQSYIAAYAEKEGIHLDAENIVKNPGRKATAKLMLNSFWGKFGENLRKSSTQQVTQPAELYALVTDPLKDVTDVCIYSDEVLEVVFTAADDECVENGKTNLFVAAFTTCHARLKLYSYLHAMQQRVLYFDTDSVIYSQSPGESELPIGDFLGDLTNEVDPGDYIVDFTSGGPKNYGYRTANGKVECKVRGFSLGSVRGHEQLNYDRLRQNVLEELTDPRDTRRVIPVINPHFFTRDATTKRLRVMPRTKDYGLVFDKRVVDTDTFKSYPYGYA